MQGLLGTRFALFCALSVSEVERGLIAQHNLIAHRLKVFGVEFDPPDYQAGDGPFADQMVVPCVLPWRTFCFILPSTGQGPAIS